MPRPRPLPRHRKILHAGLVLLATVALMATAARANDDDAVLRVGTSGSYAPFSYKDKGRLTGFDIAVVEAVARKIGYRVEWQTADFIGLFGQLDSGRIDTIANQLTITPERQGKYLFSEPYEYSADVFVVKNDSAPLTGIDDLAGKTVGVGFGTADERKLRALLQGHPATIKTFEEDPVAELNEVALGRVDAYYNGAVQVRTAIQRANLPLKTVDIPGSPYDAVGLPFAHTARGERLEHRISAALVDLKNDGTLKQLAEQWLKSDVTRH